MVMFRSPRWLLVAALATFCGARAFAADLAAPVHASSWGVWHMDDGTSPDPDASSANHWWRAHPLTLPSGTWVTGVSGTAFKPTIGGAAYQLISSFSKHNWDTGFQPNIFTVNGYFKADQLTYAYLASGTSETATTSNYFFFLRSDIDGSLTFAADPDGQGWCQAVAPAGTLAAGLWHHIVGSFDNNQCVLYVDGVEVARSGTISPARGGLVMTKTGILLGRGWAGTAAENFQGAFDEVCIERRSYTPPATTWNTVTVTNGGFEGNATVTVSPVAQGDGSRFSDIVEGWTLDTFHQTPAPTLTVDGAAHVGGNRSLKMAFAGGSAMSHSYYLGGIFLSFFQKISSASWTPDPDRPMKVTFQYKTDAVLPMAASLSDGPDNNQPTIIKRFDTIGDGAWHEASFIYNPTQFRAGSMYYNSEMWVEIGVNGIPSNPNATLWIDDITVSQAAEADEQRLDKAVRQMFVADVAALASVSDPLVAEAKAWQTLLADTIGSTGERPVAVKDIESLENTIAGIHALAAGLGASEGLLDGAQVYRLPPISNNRVLPSMVFINGTLASSIPVALAQGETTSATFALCATRDLNQATLTVSDFKDAANRAEPGITADIRLVEAWYQNRDITEQTEPPAGFYSPMARGTKELTPELLVHSDTIIHTDTDIGHSFVVFNKNGTWEQQDVTNETGISVTGNTKADFPFQDTDTLQPVSITSGTNRQFWITLKAGASVPAGSYTATISIADSAGVIGSVQVPVTVRPFALDDPDIESSLYHRPIATAYYGDDSYAQYRREIQDMAAHRVNNPMIMGPGQNAIPASRVSELLADLRVKLRIRGEEGMDNRRIYYSGIQLGDPANPSGTVNLAELDSAVRQIIAVASEFGAEEVYFFGMDEARGTSLTAQRQAWETVRAAGGRVIATSISQDNINSMSDIQDVCVAQTYPDAATSGAWQDAGKRLFLYGVPQGGVEQPDTYRRNFGLLLWQKRYDGAMTYLYHNGAIQTGSTGLATSYNDFCPNPDTGKQFMMVYPTANGVLGTVQWEGYREGMNDLAYLATLENRIAATGASSPADGQQAASEAAAWLGTLRAGDANADRTDLDAMRATAAAYIARMPVAAAAADLASGLARHYRLDESSGSTAADSSGNGQPAAFSGGFSWDKDGRNRGSVRLSGSDAIGFFATPDTKFLTVSAWVHPDSLSGSPNLLRSSQYELLLMADERVQFKSFRTTGTDGRWFTGYGTIAAGAWTHVAVSYDASSVVNQPVIWINGVKQQLFPFQVPEGLPVSGAGAATIGNRSDNPPYTTAVSGLWHLDGSYAAAIGGNGTGTGSFGGSNGPFAQCLQAGSTPAGFNAGIIGGSTVAGTVDLNVWLDDASGRSLFGLKDANGSYVAFMTVSPAGELQFNLYNGNTGGWESVTTPAAAVATAGWHNVAAQWNRNGAGWMVIKVDGVQVAGTGDMGAFSGHTATSLFVGNSDTPWSSYQFTSGRIDEVRVSLGAVETRFAIAGLFTRPLSGRIDDFRFYTRCLNDADIAGLTTWRDLSPLQSWRQSRFGATDNTGIRADSADPDHDGLANFLEYATGGDPLAAGTAAADPGTWLNPADGGDYLTLSFRRRIDDSSLRYHVEASGDLSSWLETPVRFGDAVSNPDGTESVSYRDTVPLGQNPRRFLRLRVEGD
jgi:hypothetical protein